MIERNEPLRDSRRARSDLQLRAAHNVFMALQRNITECKVEGLENIDAISQTPYEIAVSHSTGFDVPMAVHALAGRLDLRIGDQSTHHSPRHEFGAYAWLHMCGKRNYHPIDYEWRDGQKFASPFNPSNAEPMVEAINAGKSVMVAAHNPLLVDRDGRAVPPKPGIFAPYLALRAEVPILPVGVSYHRIDEPDRYRAMIAVGAPFVLESDVNVAAVRSIDRLRRQGDASEAQILLLKDEIQKLKRDGRVVLSAVQSLQSLEEGYPVIDNAYTREADS